MAEDKKPVFTFLDDKGEPMKFEEGQEEKKEELQEEEQEEQEEQEEENEGEDEGESSDSDSDNSDNSDSEDSESGDSEADSEQDNIDEEEDATEDDSDESEEEADSEIDEEEDEEEEKIVDEDIVDYDELPDSIQKALDFIEETGGSLEDFVRVNQDFSKLPQDQVIRDYIRNQNPYFDEADVEFEMERLFGIDEEVDSEGDIRKKKVAKKRYYGEAMKHFEDQRGKWKADLVSRSSELPKEVQEAVAFKQQYEQKQQQVSKKTEESRRSFVKQTDKLLGKDFKGFEVKLGDDVIHYKPENVRKVKEQNLNVNNLLNKFLDKDGNVSDVAGYHRALSVASDPEGFAQHFFELGKAAMAEEEAKDSKNVSMDKPRGTKAKPKQRQAKFKLVDDSPSQKKGKITFRNY